MKQAKVILLLYFLLGILNIVSLFLGESQVANFSKVLLMPLLFRYLITYQWQHNQRLKVLLILALLFSWFGDIFLIFSESVSVAFLMGLGSFLLAHIAYIFANRHSMEITGPRIGGIIPVIIISVILVYGFLLLYYLLPGLGEMRVPVIIYSATIMAMAITAAMRWGKTSNSSFWLVTSGAISFMISDSMIALNKFYAPMKFPGYLIMVTYILAQYLLIQGYILSTDNDK